ncbi:alpha/beta hydrolase [Sulfurimonas sp.]
MFAFYHWQYFMVFRPTYYREEEMCKQCTLLSITTQDGIELEGAVYEPQNPQATLLFFGGRSHDSVGLINRLSMLYVNVRIVTFNYRSYGKSGGVASEKAFLEDGIEIAQKVQKHYGDFYILGFSIGSSVGAYVASKLCVKGVFLVGAFDSLASLAQSRYKINLAKLYRYKFDTQEFVQTVEAPTYMFASLSDETINIKNTNSLKKKIKNLVYYEEFDTLSHKELLWDERVVNKIKGAL